MAPLYRRAYQACASGPVVERRKYGNPTVTASSPRMRRIGSSGPDGFQPAEGKMGSARTLTTNSDECTIICARGFR